jgi:nucleotide-binding universal stress UspA family protein
MSYVLTICYPAAQASATQDYAARLATALNCPLHLVHSYTIPYVVGEFPVPVITPDDQRHIAEQQLQAVEGRLRARFPALDIKTALRYGIPADVLAESVENEAPLVVILGNDESDHGETWIGTDTATMMAELAAPVLALSSATENPEISHVCLAIDRDSISEGVGLAGLEQLQEALNFRLTVVTVLKESEGEPAAASELQRKLERIGASFVLLQNSGEALSEQLIGFAAAEGADCLAVVRHERGFWNELFHKSHTGAILRKVHLPVLAFHQQG